MDNRKGDTRPWKNHPCFDFPSEAYGSAGGAPEAFPPGMADRLKRSLDLMVAARLDLYRDVDKLLVLTKQFPVSLGGFGIVRHD